MPFWVGIAALAWEVLKQIGRWVLRRIAARGRKWIVNYMQERIEVFRERLRDAKTDLRRTWLKGRIKRWSDAVSWLEKNAPRFAKRWGEKVYDALSEKVSEYVPIEDFDDWASRQNTNPISVPT